MAEQRGVEGGKCWDTRRGEREGQSEHKVGKEP